MSVAPPSWRTGSAYRSKVVPVKLAAWAAALLIVYQWAALVLEFFPYTRPWGEGLFDNLLGALGRFGHNILSGVPGLLFVALIFFVTRFIVRVVRAFFDGDVRWLQHYGFSALDVPTLSAGVGAAA